MSEQFLVRESDLALSVHQALEAEATLFNYAECREKKLWRYLKA